MREWDGNGWSPRTALRVCVCDNVYSHPSGVCPECNGEVPRGYCG